MKVSINGGHTAKARGMSSSALGFDEYTEDRKMVEAFTRAMQKAGWETHNSCTEEATQNADLTQICRLSNASGADLFVSWHFNSFNGSAKGTEVYTSNYETVNTNNMAARISEAIANTLGTTNRGAKHADYFVLVNNNRPTILIETCFGDNADDVAKFRAVGYEAIANAAAQAITGNAIPTAPSTPAATNDIASLTNEELADKIINGDFGDGNENRQARFNELGIGDRYEAVRAIVNARYGITTPGNTTVNNDVSLEMLADRMINGDFGNGVEHRRAIFEQMGIGDKFEAVRAIVNARYGIQ